MVDEDSVLTAIQRRAYDLFELRGRKHGFDWQDWFQAEREALSHVDRVRHSPMQLNLTRVGPGARDMGECIYCGVRNRPLHREHAVPYALNGPWTLLRASCENCAKITHKFEHDTLRSLWPTVRNALAMQTRRPRERSATLPLVVVRGGVRETIRFPERDIRCICPFRSFLLTGSYRGDLCGAACLQTWTRCIWLAPFIQGSECPVSRRRVCRGAHELFSRRLFTNGRKDCVLCRCFGARHSSVFSVANQGGHPRARPPSAIGSVVGKTTNSFRRAVCTACAYSVAEPTFTWSCVCSLNSELRVSRSAPDPRTPAFVASDQWPWPR